MAIRQRAIQAEDKHERHEAILDAATRLLLRSPGYVASMADVADEAGVAKGTVYLYFTGKDELLLAVHERNVEGLFRALAQRLDGHGAVTIADVLAIVLAHVVAAPLFLPLAGRCLSLAGQRVPPDTAAAFTSRMTQRLAALGAALEAHFPALAPGDGVRLLRQTYALILGLWQLSGGEGAPDMACGRPHAEGDGDGTAYAGDLERALLALWNGTMGAPARPGASVAAARLR